MRIIPFVLLFALAAAPLAAVPALADEGPGSGDGCSGDGSGDGCPDGSGSGSNEGDGTDGDDAEGSDENEGDGSNADDGVDDAGDDSDASGERPWDADEERHEARDEADRRRAALEHVRREHRDRVGLLEVENGNWSGRFIAFSPDPETRSLFDFRVGDTLLFDAIVLPPPYEGRDRVEINVEDNGLRLRGEGWRLGLTDAPSAPLRLRTTDTSGAFVLDLPQGVNVTATEYGFLLAYPARGGTLTARLVGDATGNGTGGLFVDGEATFHVSASRVVLDKVANQHRASLEAALERRALGAEMTVLRGDDDADGFVQDATYYEDIELRFEAENGTDAASTYVITIDSPSHTGRTIAINIEAGLVDPDFLFLRHFDVDANRTVEVPILRADGITDVLDPLDDGSVAEYWVVEDVDGVQLLLSMPTFSVHRIELSTIADVVVEEPRLALGLVGAVALVGVATFGMLRRPRDPA